MRRTLEVWKHVGNWATDALMSHLAAHTRCAALRSVFIHNPRYHCTSVTDLTHKQDYPNIDKEPSQPAPKTNTEDKPSNTKEIGIFILVMMTLLVTAILLEGWPSYISFAAFTAGIFAFGLKAFYNDGPFAVSDDPDKEKKYLEIETREKYASQ